ncbi:MAG: hypothetical protein NC926_10410 [Candidatus Omnitrophica bacterium]|nr:hypothetical protein [Candidatus Omnitrophota bacterium]
MNVIKYQSNLGRNISELLNKTFLVQKVEKQTRIINGVEREIMLLTCKVDKDVDVYYTFSNVLINQIQPFLKEINAGASLLVKLKKIKNYYTFDTPYEISIDEE